MNNRIAALLIVAAALSLPLALTGCGKEVSHTSTSTVKSDGTVKQKETTIRENPDGTVTKEESSKTSSPPSP